MSGSYSEQDAQEILRRAAAVQSTGFMSRDELLRAASELGITPEAVLEAEKQYQQARENEDLRIRYRGKRKAEFLESLKALVFVSVAGLLVVNWHHSWFWIVAIICAMSFVNVIKEGMRYFFQSKDANDRGFEEFKAKEARRKSLADRRANDKVIETVLQETPFQKKIEVVKHVRDLTGLPMNEAKKAVDDYYGRNVKQSS